MAITITDIAKHAKVSPMTVSRALRGTGHVHPATREHIREAANKLGYKKHKRLLLSSRRREGVKDSSLRVVLPYFGRGGEFTLTHEHDFPTKGNMSLQERFTNSLRKELEESNGWLERVVVNDIDEFISAWPRWSADGIVLRQVLPRSLVEKLSKFAPVVNAISHDMNTGVDTVYTSEQRSAAVIFEYLWNLGHRNIVWFDVVHDHYAANFEEELFDKNLPLEVEPAAICTSQRHSSWGNIGSFQYFNFSQEILILRRDYRKSSITDSTAEGLDKILEIQPKRTVVVCAHDGIALEMVRAMNKRGLSIPDDLSLVSYCGYEAALNADPPITTVELPMEEIGGIIPELIERRLANPDAVPISLQFETKLIEGGSVKRIG